MLVHKINFKVHGSSYCNENNIEIQEEIAHILKEYKKIIGLINFMEDIQKEK